MAPNYTLLLLVIQLTFNTFLLSKFDVVIVISE